MMNKELFYINLDKLAKKQKEIKKPVGMLKTNENEKLFTKKLLKTQSSLVSLSRNVKVVKQVRKQCSMILI